MHRGQVLLVPYLLVEPLLALTSAGDRIRQLDLPAAWTCHGLVAQLGQPPFCILDSDLSGYVLDGQHSSNEMVVVEFLKRAGRCRREAEAREH